MGKVQCNSVNRNLEIVALIERKLAEKDTPLDKRLHQEYLNILNEGKDTQETQLHPSANHNLQVKGKKKISRFKKWYRMAFPGEGDKIKSNMENKVIEDEKDINFKSLIVHLSPKKRLRRGSQDVESVPRSFKLLNCENDDRVSSNNDLVMDYNIVHTINQAEYGLRSFGNNKMWKLKERIAKGPPESFRWIGWVVASRLPEDRNESVYLNFLNEELDKQIDSQIKKDLHRTLSRDTFGNLEKCRTSLYRVLRAYAAADKEVTYCQGMNFIAGFLLIVSEFNEVDTFLMMLELFNFSFGDNLGIRGFYINEFPLLKVFMFQFDNLFLRNLPVLKKHFDKLFVPNELWVTKWFQTMFTICLPVEVLVRVWDCFIANGLEFLFDFTLSLIKTFEKTLLSKNDLFEIAEFFKSMSPYVDKSERININVEEVISGAERYKTSKKVLNELLISFKEKNDLDLSMLKIKYDVLSQEKTKCFTLNQFLLDDIDLTSNNYIEIKKNLFKTDPTKEDSKQYSNDLNKIVLSNENIVFDNDNNPFSLNEISNEINMSICSENENKENLQEKIKSHTLRTNFKKEKSYVISVKDDSTIITDFFHDQIKNKIIFQNPLQTNRTKNIQKKERFLNKSNKFFSPDKHSHDNK